MALNNSTSGKIFFLTSINVLSSGCHRCSSFGWSRWCLDCFKEEKKKTIKEKDLISVKEANQNTSKQKSAQCISTKKTSIYNAFFFFGLYLHKWKPNIKNVIRVQLKFQWKAVTSGLPPLTRPLSCFRISPCGPFSCHTTGSRLREKILKHL